MNETPEKTAHPPQDGPHIKTTPTSLQDATKIADDYTEAIQNVDFTSHRKLTHRQQQLLTQLVVDSDINAACKKTNVGRSTAHRWLKDSTFREELTRQRDAVLSEALDSIKILATRSVSKLAGLLNSNDDRLCRLICNDLLGHALKSRELESIERRLDTLEKNIKNNRKDEEQ